MGVHSGDPRSQWGFSRKLTEPRATTNAVDHVPELPTTRGDLLKVQRNLRNAPNRHQDPSSDCQDPWQWSGTTRFTLVIPGASGAPHGSLRSLRPPSTPWTTSQTYPETGEVQRNSRGTSGTFQTTTRIPHMTIRTHGNGQVQPGSLW